MAIKIKNTPKAFFSMLVSTFVATKAPAADPIQPAIDISIACL